MSALAWMQLAAVLIGAAVGTGIALGVYVLGEKAGWWL